MSQLDERLWHAWGETWRADGPAEDAVAALRRAVDHRTRSMRLVLAVEVAVTVATIAVVAWVLAVGREAARVGWVLAAVLHTATVWAFALWNRRGIWRPLGRSTVDYLALARERVDRQRTSANFVLAMIGVEIVALFTWVATRVDPASGSGPDLASRPPLGWWPAGAVSAVAIWWAARQRADARAEAARLTRLERQLAAEGSGG